MTRQNDGVGWWGCARSSPLWLLGGWGAVLLVLVGCSHTALQRGKSEDEAEALRYDVPVVGERTTVGNAQPVALGGVGLVEGLEGTGGDCPQDSYRAMLMEDLRKQGVQEVGKRLKSGECALVIVEAQLPPGVGKDDRIDVEVKLPPGSQATSLRGGVLRKCYLFNYDFARNLSSTYTGPNNLMLGHKLAVAQGPLLVGVGDGEESARVRSGRIWSGARTLKDNPLALLMKQEYQRGSLTSLISDRLNATFQAGSRAHLDSRVAHTADNLAIALRVPPQYKHNLPRYLRVARMVPLTDAVDTPSRTGTDRRTYKQRLADDLLDPGRTVIAALRLEALGPKSVSVLKKGLESPHVLVRFASAEALAYLGSPTCGEELARAAIEYPLLRSFALTALASLDESVCHLKLREMVISDQDDETRYGAFRALRALKENDPMVRGELLGESFWLHRIAPGTRPLVHLSTTKRAEVVLFGDTPRLKPPFSFLAGEFAITASVEDNTCTLSRVSSQGRRRERCSLSLEDVLKTMAEMGAQYPEVIALLQQAQSCDGLSCRIRVDALPQATSVHELVKAGKEGLDLGTTPTLYQHGVASRQRRAE